MRSDDKTADQSEGRKWRAIRHHVEYSHMKGLEQSAVIARRALRVEAISTHRALSGPRLLRRADKKQNGSGKTLPLRKEAATQLASTNMVTIRLLPFLAIPAQAGTHASTST
jgi:hypothetical protein